MIAFPKAPGLDRTSPTISVIRFTDRRGERRVLSTQVDQDEKPSRVKEMTQTLGHVALVVRDYDEALAFFTGKLQFRLVEDTVLSDQKRWVVIAPHGSQGTALLLAQAAGPDQASRIGNQTGGRVFLFLHTDNFWRDYNEYVARNVKFVRPPSEETYGTVAVFEDLYGN